MMRFISIKRVWVDPLIRFLSLVVAGVRLRFPLLTAGTSVSSKKGEAEEGFLDWVVRDSVAILFPPSVFSARSGSASGRISVRKDLSMKRLSIMKQPLFSTVNDHLVDYPSPSNLNYFWGFGSLAGICLALQMATGIFLASDQFYHDNLICELLE